MAVCLWLTFSFNRPPAFSQDAEMESEMAAEMAADPAMGEGEAAAAEPTVQANLTTGPTPMAIWQLTQPDWSALWQEVASVMTPPAVPPPPRIDGPTLRNEAHVAFRYGNLPLARELFFAYLTQGGEQAQADLRNLMFSSYFRRPVWQIRWGVSLGVHGDIDVEDYSPIRADGTVSGNALAGEMEGPEFANRERADAEMSGREMEEPGMEEPGGPMDEEMPMDFAADGQPGMNPRSDRQGNPIEQTPEVVIPEASMIDPAIEERFEEVMGMVAVRIAEGMRSRIASGQFGKGLADVDPEATDQGTRVGGEFVSPGEMKMWIPGILYLGEGSSREMSKVAAEAKIELLLHFDVSIKEFRRGPLQNSTRVKVIDGRNGKTLLLSGAMDSREVARLLHVKRGTAESHVSDALEKFWSILDSKLIVTPFPKLPPEKVRQRVTQLLADRSLSMLRKLAEIRYYAVEGLLSDEELENAFNIAIGAQGMTILYGSPEEAINTLRELASREAA